MDELKRASNLALLKEMDADTLLEAFLHRYNEENAAVDELTTRLNMAESQLEGYKRQCSEQGKEIERLNEENDFCRGMAKKAEGIANNSLLLEQQLSRVRNQLKAAQEEITELKKHNPKKLKEQNKRQQQQAKEKQSRINQLEGYLKDARGEVKKAERLLIEKGREIHDLRAQLSDQGVSGLFHLGDDHLMIFPQLLTMENGKGELYKSQSLLYMNQCGTATLLTYNASMADVVLCKPPATGMRPSDETLQFAYDWLFKVNEIQGGEIKDEDRVPINHNAFRG